VSEITNPHDRFFKETLSRPGVAQDFLRHYLPADVTAVLDVSAPEVVQGSFVDPELQAHLADLLYRVHRRDGGGAYVYVLFEHKSTPERWVALQLLRYMVRIWERNRRQQGDLWPIVPVVVYHGRERWRVGLTFQELFDVPQALAAYLPAYRYWLCDLTEYADEALKGEALLQVALLTLKYIFRPELREQLSDLMTLLRALAEQETGLEYVETVLRYLTQAASQIEDEELAKRVKTAFPEEGDVLMSTIAEKWIEQGLQQGMQQGIQQGVREGLLAGIEVSLELKFGERGLQLLPEIYKIEDVDVLRAVQQTIRSASTPDDLRRIYRPDPRQPAGQSGPQGET